MLSDKFIDVKRHRWKIGLCFLTIVIVLWVASGFMVNAMATEYSKPYFITYLNTATFIIYLTPTTAKWMRSGRGRPSKLDGLFRKIYKRTYSKLHDSFYSVPPQVSRRLSRQGLLDIESDIGPLTRDEDLNDTDIVDSEEELDSAPHSPRNHGSIPSSPILKDNIDDIDEDTTQYAFTTKQTAILSSQFAILWFISNLLNNASYVYTSVDSATIISCTSSFFTLIIGSMFGVENFNFTKLTALCMSIFGVWLVSHADSSSDSSPETALYGNALALGSAFLYGIYTTLLKVKIGDESRIDTKMFFGFVGLFNIIFLWPLLIILDYTQIETFALPSSSRVWKLLIINSISILVSDFSWIMAMLMTSPLLVTVGLSATIPLAMFGEMILNSRFATAPYYVGAGLVCYSFFVINRQEQDSALAEESSSEA